MADTTLPGATPMGAINPHQGTAVGKVREYLQFTESQLAKLADQPEAAVWHYYSGAATAARACLTYLGADD